MSMDVNNISMPPVSPRSKRRLDENTVTEEPAPQIRRSTDMDQVTTPIDNLVARIEATNNTFIIGDSFDTTSLLLKSMPSLTINDDTATQMDTDTDSQLEDIGEDTMGEDIMGEDAMGEDAVGQDAVGEDAMREDTAVDVKQEENKEKPPPPTLPHHVQKLEHKHKTMCTDRLNKCFEKLHQNVTLYKALIDSYKQLNKIRKIDRVKLPSKEDMLAIEKAHNAQVNSVFEFLYECMMTDEVIDTNDPNSATSFEKLQIFGTCLRRGALATSTNSKELKWLSFIKETSFFESFRLFVEGKARAVNPIPKQAAKKQEMQETQDFIINDSPAPVQVPAGDAFIHNGLELNEMLFRNFNSRVLYNYKDSTNLQSNVRKILEDNSKEPIQNQLKAAFNDVATDVAKRNEIYLVPKLLLDGGDVAHDAVKASPYNSYINALNNIGTSLSPAAFDPSKLPLCFTLPTKENALSQTAYKTFSQDKLRAMRTAEIVKLRQYIMNSNILLPNMENRTLTQQEGYFELIKHIITINVAHFVYKESGRELLIQSVRDFYKSLDAEKQEQFIVDCIEYCDVEDSTIIIRVKELITGTNTAESLQVELFPITSFDGCGTTNIMTPAVARPAIFDYVFGKYTYTVYTIRPARAKTEATGHFSYTFWHLVIVTNTGGGDVPVAMFGFAGNITINMLLKKLNIPPNRSGEGGKGMLMSIKLIAEELDKQNISLNQSIKDVINNKLGTDVSITTYYINDNPTKTNTFDPNDPNTQLLLLGNKTIGDLIYTTYNNDKNNTVYAVSTVDSLIANSAMYNFLCGNTPILPSVWMQSGGKGWKFTPGLFVEDNNQKASIMSVQILSSFMLISVLANSEPAYNELLLAYAAAIKNVYDGFETINVEPLYRFYKIINYTLAGFNIIQNYVGTDNIYNSCIVRLLIYENYVIKQRIAAYVNQLLEYIQQYLSDRSTKYKFLNNIYELPKLDTLLVSNMSSVGSNNQSAVNLSELIEYYYGPDADVSPDNIIIQTINSTNIIFTLDNTKAAGDAKLTKKLSLFTQTDAVLETTTIDPRGDAKRSVNCKVPYTIQTLIQLLESKSNRDVEPNVVPISGPMSVNVEGEGDVDEDGEGEGDGESDGVKKSSLTADDIKRLIITFFTTNISTLRSADTNNFDSFKMADIVSKNINAILFKANILGENDFSTQSAELVIDPECQECSNGVCPVNVAPMEQPATMELGGTNKKTRKKRKTKQQRKTKGGKKPGKNNTKKQRKNKKNTKTRKRK